MSRRKANRYCKVLAFLLPRNQRAVRNRVGRKTAHLHITFILDVTIADDSAAVVRVHSIGGEPGGIFGASPLTGTAQPAAGGVLGAQATLVKPAKAKGAGGVLGAVTRLGVASAHATLPFTGLQLWVVVLIALGLITGGFAVRAGRATAR